MKVYKLSPSLKKAVLEIFSLQNFPQMATVHNNVRTIQGAIQDYKLYSEELTKEQKDDLDKLSWQLTANPTNGYHEVKKELWKTKTKPTTKEGK